MSRNYGNCCNPLAKANIVHTKSLRTVSERILGLFPLLHKSSKICDKCRKAVDSQNPIESHEYPLIVRKMIEKFSSPETTKAEKELLMKLLPDSWSIRKKSDFFTSTRYFASSVTLSSKKSGDKSDLKSNKQLPIETIDAVKTFYEDDDNSRIMPGMKDTKCVKDKDNVKVFVQKRLVLYNIRELYLKFKDSHPDVKVGMTKFAENRPVHCVLAGSSGTHSVCVCVYHQNVKLMLQGLDISSFTSKQLNDYKDCIASIVCKDPTDKCYLNECKACPTIESFKKNLLSLFDQSHMTHVKFQSWTTTDRCSLQTRIVPYHDYVDELAALLLKLKTHSFTAKKQSSFFQFLKESLTEGVFLLSLDFAENYAFMAQDAAQAFHYNNDQCSVITVVVYYLKDSKLCHQSLVILSDNLVHDSVAVHCVQKIVTDWIKSNFALARKIIYFTDGASQHFKNKYNFSNLKHHKRDFSLDAEWHFHATAHGKNACDGLGATVKSNARRASLQRSSEDQILTPHQLFTWAREKFENIKIFYSTKKDYEKAKIVLEERYEFAKTVPGTLSYHSVKVLDATNQLEFRKFSSSNDCVVVPKTIRNVQSSINRIAAPKLKKKCSTLNGTVLVPKSKQKNPTSNNFLPTSQLRKKTSTSNNRAFTPKLKGKPSTSEYSVVAPGVSTSKRYRTLSNDGAQQCRKKRAKDK
ncbi:hypothetical protein QAD02_002343 [Eretmocerus hayati]|uniref:Uncharacterized protein n=1 Tax=Eretmocerus hayati TaxID=131215 RepID=A0ACC2NIY9_9HYME|nr:hypothetical protein QAD02_002343 [Eretmocerus hayati]